MIGKTATPDFDIDYLRDDKSISRLAPMYWIVMHNDPVTTMDFVVNILMTSFGFTLDKAEAIMFSIHKTGLEKITLMPLERAEFKVEMVHRTARAKGFPLTCTVELD